ncbi:hypothetical protein CPL00221_CDS0035 [Escherichia phage RobRod40]
MAIYDTGTASLAANGQVTGVGTQWTMPLTLIRVGATLVFKTEPVQIYTISEITSDTSLAVYNPNGETVPAGTGYAILAHDGISVQGLAQDVAETLRYYQSRETEVADAVDAFNNFDANEFSAKVAQVDTQHNEVVSIGAQVSNDAAQVSSDKDSASNSALSAINSASVAQSAAASVSGALVGSFQGGVTLEGDSQQIIDIENSSVYVWSGAFPKVVPQGSTPEGTGGIDDATGWRLLSNGRVLKNLENDNGSSMINFKLNNVSSVVRSVESKLGDFVNVMDFGATNNGSLVPLSSKFSTIEAARVVYPFASNLNESLDAVALQAAVNTGKTVYIPKGFMFINRTVRIGNSTRIIGEGTDQINRAQTFISVDGNINLFALVQGDAQNIRMYQIFIEGLYIFYNPGTTPTVASGNDQKIAFNFVSNVGSATGLENSCIKDCTVHGAWGCYTDTTGTYQTKLQNVWARNCRTGFIKATGTTMLLETCYASGCISPYEFGAVMSVTMINCAMDGSNISSTSGSYGGAGINFINSHSVNILGMDVEGNIIDTNGSQDCCLIRFNNSNGRISGLTGWKNEVRTTGAGSSGVVSYIKASGTSHVIIDSSEDSLDNDGLVYTGTGGYPVTIYAQDSASRIDILSGRFQSAKGGAPVISVVSQGNVNWFTEPMGGSIVGGYKQTYSSEGLKTDGVYTAKGSTVAQANVQAGLFELPNSAGLYKVCCWVQNAGTNYSVIADVLFDGTASSIIVTKTASFTTIDVSSRIVFITALGTATYRWTYTKIG